MSLRHGVTAQEENTLKHLISKGKTWEEIVALCDPSGDKTPLLADVNLDAVKKSIYDPMVKMLEAAKKAGHQTIHQHESAKKKAAAEAAAKKAAAESEK